MRRVLVPLDGSKLAETILPDAARLAGSNGELVLVHGPGLQVQHAGLPEVRSWTPASSAQEYLDNLAEILRLGGMNVQVQTLTIGDLPRAIDEAASRFGADMIACATHGRGPLGRLAHGGVAWRAAAHSSVPVLLRHPEDQPQIHTMYEHPRRIMVPLDGSAYAEKALPLAEELALEWNAGIWPVQVIPDLLGYDAPYRAGTVPPYDAQEDERAAQAYLDRIASSLPGEVHATILLGRIVDRLVEMVDTATITDIVMASHGRTGLSRVILGSVADALIQHLHCPIIVIPALAAGHLEDHDQVVETGRSPITSTGR
jgi:nucleotide-binding universal stress UspA family protein